ncbi:MAG: adenylate/guanylate cyclase domain-containing protein [Gammaproteobacteria bacterium]|nr:adenylate/guanylate cyclase domain-containing protein [Gammaproteobacteria bacterium]
MLDLLANSYYPVKFIKSINSENTEIAVMFADIAGSTKLYENIGDKKAEVMVNDCISMMASIVQDSSGEVVKTIGDEIMCCFPNVDSAVLAANGIQSHIEKKTIVDLSQLQVQIGIHYGTAIIKKGDIFGDVVNVAARMVAIAKATQIIVTSEVVELINPNLGIRTRQFDSVKVKGKEKEQLIHEVLLDNDGLTIISTAVVIPKHRSTSLTLECNSDVQQVLSTAYDFIIGRDAQCDLVVGSNLASRTHAIIEYYRGQFVLKDQSSNGTYVQNQDGVSMYLKREKTPLMGAGLISLGEPVKNSSNVITYKCK